MTRTYNIHEAKTQLSRLLEQVRRGDEVFIAKSGKTFAKIVLAAGKVKGKRMLGTGVGMGRVADDFNAPDAEIEDAFYSGSVFPPVKAGERNKKRRR